MRGLNPMFMFSEIADFLFCAFWNLNMLDFLVLIVLLIV